MVLGWDLPDGHAARGDDGLGHGSRAPDGDGEALGQLQQPPPLGPGYGIGPGLGEISARSTITGNQQPGIEVLKGMVDGPVLVLLQVPQHPLVQLLLVQSRFQIDDNFLQLPGLPWALALRITGPERPKWVKSSSPKSL